MTASGRDRTHSFRQREFLQLHCFLEAEPEGPPLDLGGPVGVGLRLLRTTAVLIRSFKFPASSLL